MLISIIVPVYNVEKYINQCIDSILLQSFSDLEIILVDDGSTDESGYICDTYADKYPYISVIHKPNGGLSDARNAGIKAAKGDYILFIDSDDYIGKGTLQQIANRINVSHTKLDVIFLNAIKFYEDGSFVALNDGYIAEEINNKDRLSVLNHLASLKKYPGSACTKLIRRKLIIENDLFFTKNLIAEDIDWTINLLTISENFAYVDTDYYYYRQNRKGSITNTKSTKDIRDLLFIVDKWAKKSNDEVQSVINAFVAYEYMMILKMYAFLSRNEKKELLEQVESLKWTLDYGRSKRLIAVKYSVKFLGTKLTAYLLNFAYKMIQ